MRLNELLSYKEICEEMNESILSGGRSRKNQLEKWQKNYEIEKIKTKYIIKREFEEYEKEYINSFIKSKRLKLFNLYEGKYEDKDRPVIYKIILDDKIYIGQAKKLYDRLYSHYITKESQGGKLLRKGGKMYVIKFTEGLDKREINKIEKSLIVEYENNENWFCVNKYLNPRNYNKRQNIYNIKIKNKGDLEKITHFMDQNDILYDIK